MDLLIENLPILLPLILAELVLALTALVHVLRYPSYRFGNKFFWILVVLLVQFMGPVIYFVFGRGEDV